MPFTLTLALTLGPVIAAAQTAGAAAQPDCPAEKPLSWQMRIDNDFFAGRDQGYTSGLQFNAATPDFARGGACAGVAARWIDARADALVEPGFDRRNVVFGLGQAILTPDDPERRDPIPGDRPYAGVLLFGVAHNARSEDALRTHELAFGVVGPAALAEETQAFFHHVFGSDRFRGWSNQLKNEAVLVLRHERAQRWGAFALGSPALRPGAWEWDAIAHGGAVLGNLRTAARAGVELRLGRALPRDFGSNPARPGAETQPPRADDDAGTAKGLRWHAFVSVDGQWVLHDLTLDGNTWRGGPSVERRPWVAEAAAGVALQFGPWRLALARTYRSREFDGQTPRPSYGSLSVARSF